MLPILLAYTLYAYYLFGVNHQKIITSYFLGVELFLSHLGKNIGVTFDTRCKDCLWIQSNLVQSWEL